MTHILLIHIFINTLQLTATNCFSENNNPKYNQAINLLTEFDDVFFGFIFNLFGFYYNFFSYL